MWHLLHTTPTSLWIHRVRTNTLNLCILYSHAYLSVLPPPNLWVPLHICSASALPTLQWINAFPCSSRLVSKSCPLHSLRSHLVHEVQDFSSHQIPTILDSWIKQELPMMYLAPNGFDCFMSWFWFPNRIWISRSGPQEFTFVKYTPSDPDAYFFF